MTLPDEWVTATIACLSPLACEPRGRDMRRYMKDVAPFLGIPTPDRRKAQDAAWKALPVPSADEVASIVRSLWALDEREYHYAACDVLARTRRRLPGSFLDDPVETLLTTTPWWDTVDSLGSAVVTPLVASHPDQVALMWQWCDSGDRWLIRAALQHQRGRREGTDLDRLLTMCARHASDREFFVAKAIGWALRDATGRDPGAVAAFLDSHPMLSPVARREATRGLARASLR
jgi:3-methyladenine DNA glycosylase AlkD